MNRPPNPNQRRAARADHILNWSCSDGDLAASLIDLLADAMHWCDAHGECFHHCLAQACTHYVHELNDDQHDERRIDQ